MFKRNQRLEFSGLLQEKLDSGSVKLYGDCGTGQGVCTLGQMGSAKSTAQFGLHSISCKHNCSQQHHFQMIVFKTNVSLWFAFSVQT